MNQPGTLKFGSRGSKLALAQTRFVIQSLQKNFPELQCEIKIIKTEGDRNLESPLPLISGKGVFVNEIEKALVSGKIDIAVHSFKDLPTEQPRELVIAAVPEREDVRDVLYTSKHVSLAQLPEGARIGTSSLRRTAQLKRLRPDLIVEDIRGNIDTRMRKVDEGLYDATILAAAGLIRLRLLEKTAQYFSLDEFLPAPAQGALAIEVHRDNILALRLAETLDHRASHLAAMAERAVLKHIGGGCALPLAVHAQVEDDEFNLRALVIHSRGSHWVYHEAKGKLSEAERIGKRVAEILLNQGARQIIEELIEHA